VDPSGPLGGPIDALRGPLGVFIEALMGLLWLNGALRSFHWGPNGGLISLGPLGKSLGKQRKVQFVSKGKEWKA
jgi:hypothetical protein